MHIGWKRQIQLIFSVRFNHFELRPVKATLYSCHPHCIKGPSIIFIIITSVQRVLFSPPPSPLKAYILDEKWWQVDTARFYDRHFSILKKRTLGVNLPPPSVRFVGLRSWKFTSWITRHDRPSPCPPLAYMYTQSCPPHWPPMVQGRADNLTTVYDDGRRSI